MLTHNPFETDPQPQFGTKQMSAEMLRRSREQIAASVALLQSQALRCRVKNDLDNVETRSPAPPSARP